MARIKLSAFDTAPDLISLDYFVGVRDNEDGTFTNYKFTYAQLVALIGGKQVVTCSENGDDMTDAYFSNTISILITNGQSYFVDNDFTQTGTTITWINGNQFYNGQKLMAIL